jgi:hypothetical protein
VQTKPKNWRVAGAIVIGRKKIVLAAVAATVCASATLTYAALPSTSVPSGSVRRLPARPGPTSTLFTSCRRTPTSCVQTRTSRSVPRNDAEGAVSYLDCPRNALAAARR